MQKYKFYRVTNEAETSSSNNNNKRSSTVVSDGNGGDVNHHDPKDETKNNDKASDATENWQQPQQQQQHQHQHLHQNKQHQSDQFKTNNVKTSDKSTNTTNIQPPSSLIYSSLKDTDKNMKPKHLDEVKTNKISGGKTVRQTTPRIRLPYKKFATTSSTFSAANSSTSKYKLIRKRSISRETDKSSFSTTTLSLPTKKPPPPATTTTTTTTTISVKRTLRSSFPSLKRANNSNTTSPINKNRKPHQDPAKYKYVKKPQQN